MVRLQYRYAFLVHIALFLAAGAARAEDLVPAAPTDSMPGSSLPPGLGLAPEAPPVPPAPGGRAPSFGAPTPPTASSFRIGGKLWGTEAVGIGRPQNPPPENYSGTALHLPALMTSKSPVWSGAGGKIDIQYGGSFVRAYASYFVNVNNQEYQGSTIPGRGSNFGGVFLLVAPPSVGTLALQFKVGGLYEVFAGPGQWGWGIFGPLLALRGYGETVYGEWDLTGDLRLSFVHGLLVVPGVDEDLPRGDYYAWIERGVSSFVHHAHAGLTYHEYSLKLHYASDYGIDERTHTVNLLNALPRDGRMDTYLAELRWMRYPLGQVGLSGGLYNFHNAASVGDGVWWAIDWTQGAREMINKFLGSGSNGNGKVAVISAEYDFSLGPILWAPRPWTGKAPDLRVAIAGLLSYTVETQDTYFKNSVGYYLGLETEYRMTKYFSLNFKSYAESRDSYAGRWAAYSINPGIAFHSDWTTFDRIELYYGRHFYSSAADPNSAQPLDHNVIALGGYTTF
jgi:hypothetical protein